MQQPIRPLKVFYLHLYLHKMPKPLRKIYITVILNCQKKQKIDHPSFLQTKR